MVSLRLKYVVEDVDRHGNVRVYFRRPGFSKIRLNGLPGSEEFQAAYARAVDVCVQLRYPTRGETSGALLRELAAGAACIPTLSNERCRGQDANDARQNIAADNTAHDPVSS